MSRMTVRAQKDVADGNGRAQAPLSRSLEDYLEAVLRLAGRSGSARVRDIARAMRVGMPSVTTAMKALSRRKLVHYDPYEFIALTARGRVLARRISRRHEVLRGFLADVLGVDGRRAEENACRMEHAVDGVVLGRLGDLARFIAHPRRGGRDWAGTFGRFRAGGAGKAAPAGSRVGAARRKDRTNHGA